MDDSFSFSLNMDIDKSAKSSDEHRTIRGYASTGDMDRQDESVLQKGLDIQDFVNFGYFNYDHNGSIILGYPHKNCRIDKGGFWVEGELIKGIPEADKIWNLAIALKKSNAPRNIGFSIEGKVLERSLSDPNKVLKAKVYNVAITPNPVNTHCSWEAIVKSFTDIDIDKSLDAGYDTNPTDMTGGSVFREEDLERSLTNLSYIIDDTSKKKLFKEKLAKRCVAKSMTARELIVYLQICKGYSFKRASSFITENKLI